MKEIQVKPVKKNFDIYEAVFQNIDDTWSMHLLDLDEHGPNNIKGYRCILEVIDNFSKELLDGSIRESKCWRSQRIL